ncbi:hypothetical protein BB561_001031 [Smittium simulii]|uniref:GST N-terminal domain-containing protein n=1 Tax=Smittium simulii TaxID=133385 RepID=A0A2T9YWI7_9FUNG|nr:hypothetical protein BB561_001031 [Smittium simulii]
MSYPYSKSLMTFYNTKMCPFAQRVAWSLLEADAEHHVELIDLKNKPTWIKSVHPEGKVPALRLTDGNILIESIPIARYIADKYPESKLSPADAFDKYKVNLFIDNFGSRIITLAFQLLKSPNQEEKSANLDKVVEMFRDINKTLLESSEAGPYLLGETLTLAEINTITFIDRLKVIFNLLEIDFDSFKDLDRFYQWVDASMSRPTFKKTIAPYEEVSSFHAQFIPK